MPARSACALTAVRRLASNDNGFSLLDVLMTIVVIGIVSTIAIVQIGEARQSFTGDGGMRVVVSQLNTARELAIAQRRNIRVRFAGANQIDLIRQDVPAGTTTLSSVYLEGGMAYALMTGLPDTPDGFGKGQAVDFGAAATIMFATDGTLIDGTGNPVNGTVYLALSTLPRSARAITILGATGRVSAYRWDGTRWIRV